MAHGLLEIAKEIGIALGVDIAFKKFTENAAAKTGAHISEKIFTDKRAELLADFMAMPADDTDNLWRWHREAMLKSRENRFVTLLCKIQPENRREMLAAMNRMSDNGFQQAMALLEHDVVIQTAHRFRDEVAIPTINNMTAALESLHTELERLVPRMQAWARR